MTKRQDSTTARANVRSFTSRIGPGHQRVTYNRDDGVVAVVDFVNLCQDMGPQYDGSVDGRDGGFRKTDTYDWRAIIIVFICRDSRYWDSTAPADIKFQQEVQDWLRKRPQDHSLKKLKEAVLEVMNTIERSFR